MGDVFLLALLAAFNPTLVAATTLMLLLNNPKRLMFGYLLGALMTSITLGIVIVFTIEDSGTTSTTQHAVNPAIDIALGAIALVAAFVVATDRHLRVLERRRQRRADKPKEPPRWQRAMNKGTARTTFVVGALLTLPGASYLAGLNRIDKQNVSTPETVLLVIVFNLIMLALLEVPLLCFIVAPKWTPGAVERGKAWLSRRARRIAVIVLATIGAALVLKGVGGLIA
ncbi:MAG TPA: GAP family protein [Solirubrobacteraceae bacterium]|nr:GAP family protein [Solirubrobacteraceae bacterium]